MIAASLVFHSNQMLNRGYAYSTTINAKHSGETVFEYLSSCYPHSTPAEWQLRIDCGEVTLNGAVAARDAILGEGDVFVWNRPPWVEPAAPRYFEVLFDDSHLFAVNKPSGLPTLPGGGFMENTLLRLVKERCAEANPVHRLGRGTSGIVLFAKTQQAAAALFNAWNSSRVEKIYRALAQGVAERNDYDIVMPIGLVPHPRIGAVWAASEAGKPSKSVARVVSRRCNSTVFEVTLHSGRPHQIRIHLASIGYPLVGDPLYAAGGHPLVNLPGLPGDGGYHLHAWRLKLSHPVSGACVEIEASLPPELVG